MCHIRAFIGGVLCTAMAWSQTPPTGLSGEAFKDWLKDSFYEGKHQALGYTQARVQMYNFIDNENNRIQCVYSGYEKTWNYGGTGSNPMPINCEHTIPQSFFDEQEPMRSDIHHLFPTYADWNSRRSNYPFSEIPDQQAQIWMIFDQSSSTIPSVDIDEYSEGASQTFEPRESHKGNVARAVFYFFTMYPQYSMEQVGDPDLFYQWHLMDPVDQKERQRNDGIEQVQGNRNPYIDHPEWVNRAWLISDEEPLPDTGQLEDGSTIVFDLAKNEVVRYQLEVPAGLSSFSVNMTGSGDADVYVKKGIIEWPGDQGAHQTSSFQAPYQSGSNETVLWNTPEPGSYEVLLHGYEGSSGQLTVTFTESDPGNPGSGTVPLLNGQVVSQTLTQGATLAFTVNLPVEVRTFDVVMTGSGDADLYVKRSAIQWPQDQGSHNEPEFQAPYKNGSAETVSLSNPVSGVWHVLVHGYAASSITLKAEWTVQSGGGGTGSWQTVSWVRETSHPYAINQTVSFTYTKSGASEVGVHFQDLNTESGYDFVIIRNGSGQEQFRVSGNLIESGVGSAFGRSDGWCRISGETITIELVTDYSVNRDGFVVDLAGYLP
jgi:hypothetical protein